MRRGTSTAFDPADRAAALRYADWRWLLPQRDFARTLCLDDDSDVGTLAASARSIAAECLGVLDVRRTADDRVVAGGYDLVLAARADADTFRRARAALRPGGVLYAERGSASRASAERLHARAGAAGFSAVQVIAPWPTRHVSHAWLPLGPTPRTRVGAAARYLLLRHPLPARHPLRRLWFGAGRRTYFARLAAGRPRDLVVVARADGSTPGTVASTLVPWWIADADRVSGAVGGAPLDWLLLTSGRDPELRVVGMGIPRAARWPTIVVKLSRTPDAHRRLLQGAVVLDRLHAAGVTTDGRVPAPLGLLRDPGGCVVASVERALVGRWLDTTLRARSVAHTAHAVTDWLIALALETRGPIRDDAWPRAFRPVFVAFAEACGAALDPALLAAAGDLLAAVPPTPTVVEHGDFRPWNVYRTPAGRLAAFDWDGGRVDGLPMLDLLHCHAFLGFTLDGALGTGRFAESRRVRELGPLGRAWHEGAARYAAAVGVSDAAARAVRAFAWMDRCKDEANAARAAGRPLTRADAGRGYLALWHDEARAALD